jgi:pimeloyl-ACP methyl ester carboxylesterase
VPGTAATDSPASGQTVSELDDDVLIMMHGGRVSLRQMVPLSRKIEPRMKCKAFNLQGHGGRPIPQHASMDAMADDLAANIRNSGLRKPFIFGHCWGGLAVLNMLSRYPDIVSGAVFAGLRFRYDAEAIAFGQYLGSEEYLAREETFLVRTAKQAHGKGWRDVIAYATRMSESFAETDPVDETLIAAIDCPVLILAAAEDSIAPAKQSLELSRMIMGSQLVVFNGTCHPLAAAPLDLIATKTANFCQEVRRLRA